METQQTKFWSGDFGKNYTDRNPQTLEDWEKLYLRQYGISKIKMNEMFVGDLPKDIRILEVGCNIGLQLLALKTMGFTNLYGIELQPYAVERSKQTCEGINIIQGSGFDIPFKDNFFGLVYTCGVLIHIAPTDLPAIMNEMIRCTNQYIWGFEYFSFEREEVNYRGNEGFLWKMDYADEFKKMSSNLQENKRHLFPYINETEPGNRDIMYLLEIR